MERRKTLEWTFTDRGTWAAEGHQWGYELIRNPNGKDINGNPSELWNLRVWRLLADADRPESRIIGGYNDVEAGKWWSQNKENDPDAHFKVTWFDRRFDRDED